MTSLQFQFVGFLNLIKPFCSMCFPRKKSDNSPLSFLFGDICWKNPRKTTTNKKCEGHGLHDMFITNDLNH